MTNYEIKLDLFLFLFNRFISTYDHKNYLLIKMFKSKQTNKQTNRALPHR